MPLLKTFFFTLLVPGTAVGLVPAWFPWWFGGSRFEAGDWRWIGVVPIAVGAGVYLRCAFDFATKGRGTPAPFDPPRAFVARGPYRFVRNPMYVGVLLAISGQALLYETAALLAYAAALWLLFHLFVVLYEERTLRRRFGESYERYRAAVPRWIPRRPPGP